MPNQADRRGESCVRPNQGDHKDYQGDHKDYQGDHKDYQGDHKDYQGDHKDRPLVETLFWKKKKQAGNV